MNGICSFLCLMAQNESNKKRSKVVIGPA